VPGTVIVLVLDRALSIDEAYAVHKPIPPSNASRNKRLLFPVFLRDVPPTGKKGGKSVSVHWEDP